MPGSHSPLHLLGLAQSLEHTEGSVNGEDVEDGVLPLSGAEDIRLC